MATATIARTGRSTPAARKPRTAGQKLVPAETPTMGGKMRLPAPKNIENSISDAITMVAPGLEVLDATGVAIVAP